MTVSELNLLLYINYNHLSGVRFVYFFYINIYIYHIYMYMLHVPWAGVFFSTRWDGIESH